MILPHVTKWPAPVFDKFLKCALAGTIADKSLVVLQFDVVADDLNGRQATSPVGKANLVCGFFRHFQIHLQRAMRRIH